MITILLVLSSWHKLALIIISLFVLISIIKIEHPGVHNDQLMFVNAATFHPDNLFLWKSYNGFPVMVFPYIGALKSYFYIPIFYFFDVNIWSIRLPQILLTALTYFIFLKSLEIGFNKKVALLTLLFVSIDTSLIAYSRIDTGPTVFEFLFKVIAVYLLFLYLKFKNYLFLMAVLPILALGLFNKLNFFWFINAFLFSFLAIYGLDLYHQFKGLKRFIPTIFIVFSYLFLLKIFSKLSREVTLSYKNLTSEVAVQNIFINFDVFINNLSNLINGNLFFSIVYGFDPVWFGDYYSALILGIIFLGIFVGLKTKNEFKKPFLFFGLIVLLTAIQILLTKKAVNPWHNLALFPFIYCLLAISVFFLFQRFKKARIFLIFITIFIVLYQLAVNTIYINQYSLPTKHVGYSSEIYSLVDFTKSRSEKFVCGDVDICNQLISFDQKPIGKYKEPFPFLDPPLYPDSFRHLVEKFNYPNDYLYVFHGPQASHFPNFRQSFFEFLDQNTVKYEKIEEFNDGQRVIFEIYKIGYF